MRAPPSRAIPFQSTFGGWETVTGARAREAAAATAALAPLLVVLESSVAPPLPSARVIFARAPRKAALRARKGVTSFSRRFSPAPFPPP